jgi:hypothetical protein
MAGQDYGVDSGSVTATQYRAKVAWVSYSVNRYK